MQGRYAFCVTAALVAGVVASGCGGTDDTAGSSASGPDKARASLDGDGKTIVSFDLSKSFPWIAAEQKAARAEAARLGYKLKIIENGFDANLQNNQIQQYVSTGQAPAAFFWLPVDPASQVNPLRQLARVAPVFQIDAQIQPFADKYVTGYAGIDGVYMGRTNGGFAVKLRAQDRRSGRQLHSPAGNLIYLDKPVGFRIGELTLQGFRQATARDPFNVLRIEHAGVGAQPAYEAVSQLIPKYKAQGIDYIFASNVDTANGVVKALKENGLQPGKDVKVIAGDCSGDLSLLAQGQIENCGVSSGAAQGKLVIDMIAQYLASGKKIRPGATQLAASRQAPPVRLEPPTRSMYTPYPEKAGKGVLAEDCVIWGLPCVEATGASR